MENYVKRVLMVDDDIELCESMRDYLEGHTDQYKFLGSTSTFSTAIEMFKDGMPNVVILDMMLGAGLDGSDIVDEFRRMEKELNFRTNIFIVSKSGIYENYCAKNHLIFMQKGENNPELMMKRVERFVDTVTVTNQTIRIPITPPKARRDRMKDNLWALFSSAGAIKYNGCEDCMYIIPRVVELTEEGSTYALDRVYVEWSKQSNSTKEAIEGRVRNMLKTLWSKAPIELLKQLYPPTLGDSTYPTPLPFIEYHAKRLMREYPKNIEE